MISLNINSKSTTDASKSIRSIEKVESTSNFEFTLKIRTHEVFHMDIVHINCYTSMKLRKIKK